MSPRKLNLRPSGLSGAGGSVSVSAAVVVPSPYTGARTAEWVGAVHARHYTTAVLAGATPGRNQLAGQGDALMVFYLI